HTGSLRRHSCLSRLTLQLTQRTVSVASDLLYPASSQGRWRDEILARLRRVCLADNAPARIPLMRGIEIQSPVRDNGLRATAPEPGLREEEAVQREESFVVLGVLQPGWSDSARA